MPEQDLRPGILVLTSTLPRWHGDATPRFVLDLCRALTQDFAVHVLAPHAGGARLREDMDGVSVHRFRYFPEAWQSLAYDGGIPERLRRQPLALLQVPFFLAAQFFAALWLAWTLHPRVIHAHWILPQGLVAMLVSRLCRSRPRLVVTVHGADLYTLNAGPVRWLKSFVLTRQDRAAAVSAAMVPALLELGLSPDQLHVAPMGVDVEGIFRADPAVGRDGNLLVFAGRLVPKKGVDVLLKAFVIMFAQRPALRLVIVGDGPERGALVRQAQRLGIAGRVEFRGALPQQEVAGFFRRASVAVFPFVSGPDGDREGLGLVVVEAQACGCPVIASDIPAMRDLIVPEVTGLKTPPGNPERLAQAVERMLLDAGLAQRIARAGRTAALERFSWPVVGNRYRELLRELIQPANQS